ncbi:ABC transporter permease [Ruminococcus sp. CLA-AA-H200]|uniref:ABC transporter permease n=1 Tax=Ruminococcus turbiniformis TaxID=2881258 RepID=A0ABS8FUC8_9FIRM|nr:ABC transporter permease [Ruminococcus turbiniformis]MCC2253591.1 ABC transporter permease [Ruminococcus turbiniformis]
MAAYTLKRLAAGIVSLFVLATATFFLVRLIPGSPFQNGGVSSQVVEAVEEEYGLNEPLLDQYITYMGNLIRGDLGVSYQEPGTSVAEVIKRTWPVTASLGAAALLAAVIFGTGLGILRAVSKYKAIREGIAAVGMIFAGIPNFAAAILLLLVFSVKLGWFPSAGLLTPAHYVLPVISLMLYPMAVISRLTGNALATEMEKQYVLFARAKGLGNVRILFTHTLKNAWIPVLNYVGPASASLLTGSFVAESIFTIPGLGREFVSSITNRDYTLILGLTVFMGTVVITVNLITDLVCAWMDPGTRRGYGA